MLYFAQRSRNFKATFTLVATMYIFVKIMPYIVKQTVLPPFLIQVPHEIKFHMNCK
jgi:hypothetical protein